ncbi:MAG: amidohydrolase family protein [Bacteroidota bacterium]
MRTASLSFLLLFLLTFSCFSQKHYPENGLPDPRHQPQAFTNATIFVDYQTKIENATLLVQEGKVVAVGTSVEIPENAVVTDLEGKFIYPSFIDLHTNYGMPEVKRSGFSWSSRETISPQREGAFNLNDAIKADFVASESFKTDEATAKKMRAYGFGTALAFRPDGAARGSGTLVTLGDHSENEAILKGTASAHYAFSKGSSKQDYPTSIMGYVALLRQTYLDADWYFRQGKKEFYDQTLEGWQALQKYPQFFETSDRLNLLRADGVGDEFGVQYIFKGNGDEYQRLEAIKNTNGALIIPLNFPNAYDVSNPYAALDVSLEQLKHWELAPTNPKALAEKQIAFAFTTEGTKSAKDFFDNLRKAIEHGLSEEAALKALTLTPASLIQAEAEIGALRKGMLANFIITSDDIFEQKTKIYDNYVRGKRHEVNAMPTGEDVRGTYELKIGEDAFALKIEGKTESLSFVTMPNDTTKLKTKGSVEEGQINLQFTYDDEVIRLGGWRDGKNWKGDAKRKDGKWSSWSATFSEAFEEKESEEKEESEEEEKPELGEVFYPFIAYGTPKVPEAETILFHNATVWTNESEGILENTDVLVKDGKISKVGKGLKAPSDTRIVDATGKHITSGIIDEHSHIALTSVNDVAVISAMVRMQDAVDSEDPDIYRQVAGGVTAAQLLHGSANPVGGQSALVKLRWGASPEEMLIKNADPFIKFALGENVKRSWNSNSVRYPQTRMGVEQVYRSAFTQAKEYEQKWADFRSGKTEKEPRRDLGMEAVLEIVNSERFISCHSYVQSEITMLMRVAEDYGFRVNTFTHILEGYKVADRMKKHGVGASTFADWWLYKFEVYDAIAYNAALMHEQGLVVAINSDDAEMGRRLNQEAAKAVKYGGVSEEEAWKMVTLNPAKLLHLEDRMGSLKAGKDGDVVLLSDNPLSIYAKTEMTLIDGKVYFERTRNQERQTQIQAERDRIIQKMLAEKAAGKPIQKPAKKIRHNFHCDDMVEER